MLAQSIGAQVFATVSTDEKKALLMDTFGLPADQIFPSRNLSFAHGIMNRTANRGVDVVLNSLSGDALRKSWECVANFGRFVEIGKKDIYSNGRLEMFQFSKSATFAAVDLNLIIDLDPKTGGRLLESSLQAWKEGKMQTTTPYNVYDYGQIEFAFRHMQAGKHIGKIVLKPNPEDLVQVW